MKKILSLLVLFAVMMIGGVQNSRAEAADYYLGVYEDGCIAYLMTHTLEYYKIDYGQNDWSEGCKCSVKAVYPNSNHFDTIAYELSEYQIEILKVNGRSLNRHEMQALYEREGSVEMNLIHQMRRVIKQNSPTPQFISD